MLCFVKTFYLHATYILLFVMCHHLYYFSFNPHIISSFKDQLFSEKSYCKYNFPCCLTTFTRGTGYFDSRAVKQNFQLIHHLHISNNAPNLPPPPNFAQPLFVHFSCVLQQPSQEKLKAMLMQNFGGQIRCIMVDMQKTYAKLSVSEDERKKWASSENASKQITESLCMRVEGCGFFL